MDNYTGNQFYNGEGTDEESRYQASSVENDLRKTIQRQKKTMFRLMERINRLRIICAILFVLLAVESFLWWCNSGNSAPDKAAPANTGAPVSDSSSSGHEDGAIVSDDVDEGDVESIVGRMSMEEKIYQMIFTTPENLTGVDPVTAAGDSTRASLEKYPVGGLVYSKKNFESIQQIEKMMADIKQYPALGLFLAVSDEGNTDSPFAGAEGVEPVTYSVSEADSSQISQAYADISENLRKLGFNVNFAPRSENGGSAEDLSGFADAAVKAAVKNNVCPAIKYFPSSVSGSDNAESFGDKEFASFKSGIDAGADFVIVSNALGGEKPFSLDSRTYTTLRDKLGFDGVILTDSMNDSSVIEKYASPDAAVEAIKAGADMAYCPTGVAKTVEAVKKAVDAGEITSSSIDEKVKRIIRIKLKRGITD